MSVISFEEWKKKHGKTRKDKARQEDRSRHEEYGLDLCNFIAEESKALGVGVDYEYLLSLADDLDKLIERAVDEEANIANYFKAFKAFRSQNQEAFNEYFTLYLEGEIAVGAEEKKTAWWVEHFLWTFLPPYAGFYSACAAILFEYYPESAMSYIFEALELSEGEGNDPEPVLEALCLARQKEAENPLCDYLVANVYFDQQQWQNALMYLRRAEKFELYANDAAFLFDCGWAAEKCGELNLAEAYYARSSEIDEYQPCALNNLGCLKMQRGQNATAYLDFMYAVLLGIDGVLPYRNALIALERQGKYGEAIAFVEASKQQFGSDYERALKRLNLLQENQNLSREEKIELFPRSFEYKQQDYALKCRNAAMILDLIKGGEKIAGRSYRVYEDERGYGCQYYLLDAGLIELLLVDEADDSLHLFSHCVEANEMDVLRMMKQADVFQKTVLQEGRVLKLKLICSALSERAKEFIARQNLFDIEVLRQELRFRPME